MAQPRSEDLEDGLEDGLDPPLLGNQPLAQSDGLLYACTVLSVVTALAAVLCMVVNLISLLRSFDRGVNVFVGILRCYAVAIAFFVAIAETEWEPIFRLWRVLEYWVGRGVLQIFVAVLTRVLARSSGERRYESLLHQIASWWLLGCGTVYIVAGLLCIGNVKRMHLKKVKDREQAVLDLEEVHRRRAELEAMLGRQAGSA